MKAKKTNYHLKTNLIVSGNSTDKETGAVIPPVHFSTTYVQNWQDVSNVEFDYSRTINPTRSRLEQVYADIEYARYAISVASGLAAETLILQSLPHGSHIIASKHIYGGTYRLFEDVFAKTHNFSYVDLTDLNEIEDALRATKQGSVFIWIESPTNPLLHIIDLKAISSLAKQYKARTIVDNTFASPVGQNPLLLGIDLVFHSATKYLNGHSDVLAGAIMLNNQKWYNHLFDLQNSIGATQSPMDSWLILRGLKTLNLRMQAHSQNAIKLAKWLSTHHKVSNTIYPGLTSHPQYKIAKKQMNNFGGMVTIKLKDKKSVRQFLKKVRLFRPAVSLGGVESLVAHPATMTHASMPENLKNSLGITSNIVRLSVGIEHLDDLQSDIENALK